MKFPAYFAAFAAAFAASAAQAQDATSAFQCAMPYEQSMMALGSLEVLEQSTVAPFPGLNGEGNLITFDPAGMSVYGAKPQALSLKVLSPHKLQPKQKYVVTLSSSFAKAASADEAIQKSVQWHLGCGALSFCIRSSATAPEGAGRLEYRRNSSLELNCIFEFTPEEFDALGS